MTLISWRLIFTSTAFKKWLSLFSSKKAEIWSTTTHCEDCTNASFINPLSTVCLANEFFKTNILLISKLRVYNWVVNDDYLHCASIIHFQMITRFLSLFLISDCCVFIHCFLTDYFL
jgi:hypothetical protein